MVDGLTQVSSPIRYSLPPNNESIAETMDVEENKDRAKCRLFRPLNPFSSDDLALMYTVHSDGYESNGGIINSFWQIQICPFFLDWALPKPTRQLLNTVATGTTYKRLWRDVTVKLTLNLAARWKYTPIDAVSGFDKVLLHEVNF